MNRSSRNGLWALSVTSLAVLGSLLGTPVYAQQDSDCERLNAVLQSAGDELLLEFEDAQEVVEADRGVGCRIMLGRIASRERVTNQSSETQASEVETTSEEVESTSTTVNVAEEATIEGEVEVRLPDPEVMIEQGEADVSVTTSPPEVTVNQGQPVIEVRQAQPVITVRMSQPTITVEQPAPEIIITMPEPGVDVNTTPPQVSVSIPEPLVTVRQPAPSLNVDLDAETSTTAQESTPAANELDRMDEGGVMTVRATGQAVDESNANVRLLESEEQAVVNYQGAEPQVHYIAAEPEVSLETEGELTVDVIQSGEPKVVIRQARADAEGGNQQQQSATQRQAAMQSQESMQRTADNPWDPAEAFAQDESRQLTGETQSITVADVEGMEVVNTRDEVLGNIDRIVTNGNERYVIISHGGWFFGLNDKEVAYPVEELYMTGDKILLSGLTEEQIEALPEYDYTNERTVAGDETLEVTVVGQ